ncbi:hypothetical protein LNM18_003907 [Salmonella enterica subsp. enterica serovar Ealing]|jgi:hypothetical protein|nr:hypothetical protein [Salmonella enterica subsp. enterica serovar Minnesota]EIM5291229.1 hypothetical protein [Salmonella enterica subsp. enterica serovar Ealing]
MMKGGMMIIRKVAMMGGFTVLVFLRPVFNLFCRVGSYICLLGFLFCLFIMRGGESPVLPFFFSGLGLTAFMWLYDSVLGWLLPGSDIYTEK